MRGSVLKRGKSWSYVLYLGRGVDGRTRQKWVGGFTTKKLAEAALVSELEQMRTGRFADPGTTKVAEFCERWLEAVVPTLRPSTARSYTDLMHNWVEPRIGSVRLAHLDAGHIARLHSDLLKNGRVRGNGGGLSPRTVGYVHRVLHHALRDAGRWGLLPNNPAELINPPRVVRKEMQAWSPSEARRFLEHVDGDRLATRWSLFVTTGLRRGEVLSVRWKDVDLDRGVLAVRQTYLISGKSTADFGEPKTAKGRRTVSLDADTVAELRRHRRHQLEERLVAGSEWGDHDLVFTDEMGSPLHPNRITIGFKRLAIAAGLPPIRLHDLRHTAATLALSAGIHPKIVSERLGHSTISITLDTYSHVIENLQADAADQIRKALFGDALRQEETDPNANSGA